MINRISLSPTGEREGVRGMLVRYAALAAILLVVSPADASVFPVPRGWHAVSLSEFRGTEDFHFRLKQPNEGLRVVGDFDGDGRVDVVRVLESDDRKHCAMFVTHFPNGIVLHHELANLDSNCRDGLGQSLYVVQEDASRSPIKTWCGKGVFCERGDTNFLRVRHTSFGYGFYEASYSIVMWDQKTHKWRAALISD